MGQPNSSIEMHVTLAYAQSLDGRIATITGDSRWISSKETLEIAHRLRSTHDAVAVGIGTIMRDDPMLTCRIPNGRNPLRVLYDCRLRIPLDSKIVSTAKGIPTILFLGKLWENSFHEKRMQLETAGIKTVSLDCNRKGELDLQASLAALAKEGARTVLVEGGSALLTSFLRQRLVKRMVVVTAPLLIGEGIPAFGDLGIRKLEHALRWKEVTIRIVGKDVVWELEW